MQQRGSRYFARRPPPPPPHYIPDPVDGVSRSKFTFSEHGHVIYQIKENQECTKMVTISFRTDPPNPLPVLWIGSVGHNSNFSEHSHVTYQIKENQKCTNMVANILLADPLPLPHPRDGVSRSKHFLRTWTCCISN